MFAERLSLALGLWCVVGFACAAQSRAPEPTLPFTVQDMVRMERISEVAVAPDGATYVTDSNNMQVDRLARGTRQLKVWAGDGAFGPRGGILDGISILDNRIYVNTLITSRTFSVPIDGDGKAGAISEVVLSGSADPNAIPKPFHATAVALDTPRGPHPGV